MNINLLRSILYLTLTFKFKTSMKDKTYNNADSFVMSFDKEWRSFNCDDISRKIDKIIETLSDHPFVISSPENARNIAKFRIYTLKKFA